MTEENPRVRQIIEGYFGESLDPVVYDKLEDRLLRGGEWLFRQGDPGDSLYFLVRGRLQAWARGEDGEDEGRLLGEVSPGDSVGEAGLLTEAPRTAGIKAIRDSLLIKLEKKAFEGLAGSHPGMVMRLAANVATMLQKNLANSGNQSRRFNTVCLLPLHQNERVREHMGTLISSLAGGERSLLVDSAHLSSLGAPMDIPEMTGELPESLKQWLADQENQHDLVVYPCPLDNISWTRFALRQADIVLLIADAGEESSVTETERRLLAGEQPPSGHVALVLCQPAEGEIRDTRQWLEPRKCDFHLHVRGHDHDDIDRVVRIVTGTATGLVLGAGAVRGLAELGVFKALVEFDVAIDWVGGSSIGSIVGAAVAHDWTPEHAIDVARKAFVKGKPFSDYTLPVISLIRGRRMMRLLETLVNVEIEDLPIPYFCVSSNLDRGELCVHESGSLVAAIRASAALPGVLPPAVVDRELVVDGAVLNNLPVDVMKSRPVGRVIAVDVSARSHRTVDFEETPSSWAIIRGRWLPFARRHRVPGLATVILRATEIGTLREAKARGDQADLLINPPVRKFGMTDVKAFDQIVEAGYRQALEDLKQWRQDS